MRISLIFVLVLFVYLAPAYGLRPSESEYLEPDTEEAAEISEEKERIIEAVMPARKEREKNLHPFVQDAGGINTPIHEEGNSPHAKSAAPNLKTNAGINFIAVSIIVAAFLLSYFFIRPESK